MHSRKVIQSALTRQDYAGTREAYSKMLETGRDDPVTKYLMFKVGLQSGDMDLGAHQICSIGKSGY